MNYFAQVPEELLYIILTYVSDYKYIDTISRIFKLYINYEEMCMVYMPETYQLIIKELYKHTEPPNYYLIYMAFVDFSNENLIKVERISRDMFNYSNIHGLNYIVLYYIYTVYNKIFPFMDKFPEHIYKYPCILLFIEEFLKKENVSLFKTLFSAHINLITRSITNVDYNIYKRECERYLGSIDYNKIDNTIVYRKLIIDDLIHKLNNISSTS
jgi:hypothetical protein